MEPWRPVVQFAIQQLSTQVLNPTTESKRALKQLIRYLKGTEDTCLRREPREMVQEGLLELVGQGDSDWAGDSATRKSVTGYHCNVQNVTMCNWSLNQTAISLSSCEAEFYAASACAGELLGFAELFKELHHDVAVRLEMDSDSASISAAQETRWTQTHRNTMLGNTTVGTRETSTVSRVDTKNNTAHHPKSPCVGEELRTVLTFPTGSPIVESTGQQLHSSGRRCRTTRTPYHRVRLR